MRAWRGSTASRAARRCGRGCTASPPTSASTCSTGRQRRARPMDLGPSRTGRRAARSPPLPEATWVEPMPDGRVLPEDGDPAERGRGARVDPPRLRGRPAAPAAAPAGGADPARGAALAGHRGGRAARHHRRLGQQRPAAGPGHAAAADRRATDRAAVGRPTQQRAAGALRRRLRALRHRRRSSRCCTRTPPCRMPSGTASRCAVSTAEMVPSHFRFTARTVFMAAQTPTTRSRTPGGGCFRTRPQNTATLRPPRRRNGAGAPYATCSLARTSRRRQASTAIQTLSTASAAAITASASASRIASTASAISAAAATRS